MKTLRGIFGAFLRFLYRSRKTIILIIVVAVVTIILNVSVAVWLNRSYNLVVPSVGAIYVTNIEAYGGDLKFVNGVAAVDWGTIQWGDSRTVSFYLRSTSSVPTRIGFNVTDWNPERMKNYVTLLWNYNGTLLSPQQEILVIFTLSTPDTKDFADYLVSNSVNSYNFTIYIYALK